MQYILISCLLTLQQCFSVLCTWYKCLEAVAFGIARHSRVEHFLCEQRVFEGYSLVLSVDYETHRAINHVKHYSNNGIFRQTAGVFNASVIAAVSKLSVKQCPAKVSV